MGASVTLLTPAVAVDPGAEVSVELRLRNTGGVVDEFTLDVLGDAAGWASVDPPTVSLFPGAEGAAKITFRPPRQASTPTGQVPFGLRARSREDPAGSAVEEGTVDVGAFVEPFVELVPRTSRGARGANHELAVDNRGNTRLNAQVDASDDDRLLVFDVNPPGIVVEPGMAGFTKVRVKPAKRFWRGMPKSRPFRMTVTPEGRMPITVDGTMLQESVLPPWFGRLVAALIIALIAAIILWLLVLKPAINSAVTQAVESPIADLRDDVNSALGGAGLPTLGPNGGGGGASPSPEASGGGGAGASESPSASDGGGPAPTPTSGVLIPGLGNPVDGRLDSSATSVSPTGTLFLTDVVFSNPNGREGALVVLRDSTPLWQLRLENFRDYDLHFVTPIVVTKGQSLKLSLACTPASPCDAAVFYSGYLRP